MLKVTKLLSVLLVFVLAFSVLAAGCSSNNEQDASNANNKEETKDSGSEKEEGKKEDKKEEKRIKMSLFYGNSGLAHPGDVDPSDNKFINVVEDYANVDLDVSVPSYQDFQTKYNLLLASGDLPDVLHTWFPDDTYEQADDGAFIDLKEYYDNSPQVQKYITPEMMELSKSPSGHYYRIPMAWGQGPQGLGVEVRYDLVEKYNNGKIPESVDEWVDVMRKIHKAHPDWSVMSNRVIGDVAFNFGGMPIFYWYGATPYNYRIDGGKIIPNVVLPEYHEAVALMRQLYEEGILDKEFATNDLDAWQTKVLTKNVLLQLDGGSQTITKASNYKTGDNNGEKYPVDTTDWKYGMAPPLKKYPDVLKDPKYLYTYKSMPITGHGMYIPSSTENKDRAWKVIEGFASDELWEKVFWGEEGVSFKREDGKRILTDATKVGPSSDDSWALHMGLLFGFVDGQDVKRQTFSDLMGKEYADFVYGTLEPLDQMARKNGLGQMPGYAAPEEATKKTSESRAAINKFTIAAIMGKISMEEFDQEVEKWENKYGDLMFAPMQKYLDENKEVLIKKGFKMAGW